MKVTGAHLELLSRSDGMTAVLQLRLTEPVVRKVLLTAHRFIASVYRLGSAGLWNRRRGGPSKRERGDYRLCG